MAFFDDMRDKINDYEHKHNEAKLEIDERLASGMDVSDIEIPEYPYDNGETKAYWSYREMLYQGCEVPVFFGSLWHDEVESFVSTLRKGGCEQFIYMNDSSLVMENIHDIVGCGCELMGLYAYDEKRFDGSVVRRRGIRFGLGGKK